MKKKQPTLAVVVLIIFLGYVMYNTSNEKKVPQSSMPVSSFFDKSKTDGGGNPIVAFQSWGNSGAAEGQLELSPQLLAKNYYIILDTSGSMGDEQCVRSGDKMQAAKKSLSKWIQNVSPNDNIALMAFRNENVAEVLPLYKNTSQYKQQFINLVNKEYPNGGTPLGQSLGKAYDALAVQANSQLGYGEYHIVVVTDGAASDYNVMENALGKVYDAPIVLHTIGFCIDNNHALNQPGKSYYISAMNEEELSKSLQGVLAESETFDVKGF